VRQRNCQYKCTRIHVNEESGKSPQPVKCFWKEHHGAVGGYKQSLARGHGGGCPRGSARCRPPRRRRRVPKRRWRPPEPPTQRSIRSRPWGGRGKYPVTVEHTKQKSHRQDLQNRACFNAPWEGSKPLAAKKRLVQVSCFCSCSSVGAWTWIVEGWPQSNTDVFKELSRKEEILKSRISVFAIDGIRNDVGNRLLFKTQGGRSGRDPPRGGRGYPHPGGSRGTQKLGDKKIFQKPQKKDPKKFPAFAPTQSGRGDPPRGGPTLKRSLVGKCKPRG